MLKYPELDDVSRIIADHTCEEINRLVEDVKSKMPYRRQYVLEEVVKILTDRI
jgi:hypothetical protein